MFFNKWNGKPEEGEKVSDQSKVEPFFTTVQEQVERLLLAGQNLIDERAYEFLPPLCFPDSVPLPASVPSGCPSALPLLLITS